MRSHARVSMRLSERHERWIYLTAAILFLSGLGWLIAHYFLAGPAQFGERHHVSEPWFMRVHGAAVMAFLIALGSLFPGHIVRAWKAKKNRRTGLLLLAILALLIITGYGLYYIADEDMRPWLSLTHWGGGLVVVAGLLLHVVRGRKTRAKPRVTATHAAQPETSDSVIAFPQPQRGPRRRG